MIFLLKVVLIKTAIMGNPTNIHFEAYSFETAERCLRSIPLVRKELESKDKYNKIRMTCTPSKLYKGK